MKRFRPEKIFVEKDALQDPLTCGILERSAGIPVEILAQSDGLIEKIRTEADPFTAGKKILLIKRQKGQAFKPFPLIPEYLSCHFQILHLGMGCDYECTYCFLQSYLNNPVITVFSNLDEILMNLGRALDAGPGFVRVGTGELIDSLSLDHLTEWSLPLVKFFSGRTDAVLELKTKSDNVENLRKVDPKGRVIVSWSLNTERIQKAEELKTASISERLEAAARCADWGYKTGFHFDPLVDYPGCEKEYAEVVARLFERIPSEKIAWISLGALRFVPELKTVAEERFPKTPVFTGEFVRGLDGKSRYFKPIRKRLYTTMRGLIRKYSAAPIYLCMESPELWEEGLGTAPRSSQELKSFLDATAQDACRLL